MDVRYTANKPPTSIGFSSGRAWSEGFALLEVNAMDDPGGPLLFPYVACNAALISQQIRYMVWLNLCYDCRVECKALYPRLKVLG